MSPSCWNCVAFINLHHLCYHICLWGTAFSTAAWPTVYGQSPCASFIHIKGLSTFYTESKCLLFINCLILRNGLIRMPRNLPSKPVEFWEDTDHLLSLWVLPASTNRSSDWKILFYLFFFFFYFCWEKQTDNELSNFSTRNNIEL